MSDDEVRARLARLPRPPMPQTVAVHVMAGLDRDDVVVPLTRTHRRRMNWLLAAAAAAAFVMLVSWSTGPAPSPVTDPPVVRAGAVFQPADLGTQLQARFVGAPATVPTRTFADTPQGIVACAQSVKAYGRVMAVDVGTYAAADAVVLVTSYVPNTDYEEVWVVGPQCGTGSPTVMRHMLMDVDGSTAG